MKKFLAGHIILLFLWTAVSLAETPAMPVFEWERNITHHWQLDEQGHAIRKEAHQLDDLLLCAVCGSEVWDYGDGSGDVNNYDEKGNLLRYTNFDAEGIILYDSVHALTYDENGVLAKDLEYIDGLFFGEYIYTADAEGNPLPVTHAYYYDDGTGIKSWFDENGNEIRIINYDETGAVISEMLREYARDEDGWYYEAKTTMRFAEGEEFYTEYNAYGDETRKIYSEADGTVWLDQVYEYEYAQGVKKWCKAYEGGRLVLESVYDESGRHVMDIEYQEDGSFTEIFYDEEDDDRGFFDFFGDWLN